MRDLDVILIFGNDRILLHPGRLDVRIGVSGISHSHRFSDLGILNVFVVERKMSWKDVFIDIVDVVVDERHMEIEAMAASVRRVESFRYNVTAVGGGWEGGAGIS